MTRRVRFADALVFSAMGLASVALQQNPPPPDEELRAQARIPAVAGTVTDSAGSPIVKAAVNYERLASGLGGGTQTGPAGQFQIRHNLGYSASTGWRLDMVGPLRVEVIAKGFRRWVTGVIVAKPGETQQVNVVLLREDEAPQAKLAGADVYRARAPAAIVERLRLRRQAIDDVQIEVVGDPILRPDHQVHHRSRASAGPSDSLPEAFVLAAVRRSGSYVENALVMFAGEQAEPEFSYSGSSGFLPLAEEDRGTVARTLADFYATAADISQGPERFYAYFDDDVRSILRHRAPKMRLYLSVDAVDRGLTPDALRAYLATMLDLAVLRRWFAFEGLDPNTLRVPPPAMTAADSAGALAQLVRVSLEARQLLADLGALGTAHLELSTAYVRRLLGEGLFARENPARDGIASTGNLPMYSAPLGGYRAALFPHFIFRNGRAVIVAIDLP